MKSLRVPINCRPQFFFFSKSSFRHARKQGAKYVPSTELPKVEVAYSHKEKGQTDRQAAQPITSRGQQPTAGDQAPTQARATAQDRSRDRSQERLHFTQSGSTSATVAVCCQLLSTSFQFPQSVPCSSRPLCSPPLLPCSSRLSPQRMSPPRYSRRVSLLPVLLVSCSSLFELVLQFSLEAFH